MNQQCHARARILVVEDEWILAEEMEVSLREAGFDILGPVPSVKSALHIVETEELDAAVLNITLNSETSFPVARALIDRRVPFVFVTGHAAAFLPPELKNKPLLSKPVNIAVLNRYLEALLAAAQDKMA
ncbi:MAG: response regulator [Dongiaceae bacterium]